jgi:hypothetical protein
VRFWIDAARGDAERGLQRRITTSFSPRTTTDSEVEDQELLSYEDLFSFLVRRSRADFRAGEETQGCSVLSPSCS